MPNERQRPLDVRQMHDTAVVLHLYYPEMWERVCCHLRNLGPDFDLLVTIPSEVDCPERAILDCFPSAQLFRCENRGRDVAPFLQVLASIAFLPYKYVCKLHTKKSPHIRNGDVWHEDMVTKLLASPDAIARVRGALDGHPQWGLVAPRGHVLPISPESYYWGQNADNVLELARASGMHLGDAAQLTFSFVGGSMFWFKPAALRPLANLELGTDAFEPETGQVDGTMAHAVERFIGLSARQAGFAIVECDAEGVRAAEIPFHMQLLAEQAQALNGSKGLNQLLAALQVEVKQRALEVERLVAVTESQQRDRDKLQDLLVKARADADALGAALKTALADLATTEARVAAAGEELVIAKQNANALTEELARTTHRLQDLLASASWRWMAPARAIKRLLTREAP